MTTLILQWQQQIGSSADEDILSVSLEPAGFIFVGGYSRGQLGQNSNAGGTDGFLVRYSAEGERLWLKQIGTENFDQVSVLHADSQRAVYAAGFTGGRIDQEVNKGQTDAFVVKYDTLGKLLWQKQIGTTSSEGIRALATDQSGNLFVGGATSGSLDGNNTEARVDAFVGKFDPQGNQLWIRQLVNTGFDYVEGICVDAKGNVYAAGYTEGDFDREADEIRSDGFIVKYSPEGEQRWIKRISSDEFDFIHGIACSPEGNLYVGGVTEGRIGSDPQNFRDDAFLGKYNEQGDQIWIRQLGSNNFDGINSIDIDEEENVYVGGYTRGQLGSGKNQGASDAFLAKYNAQGIQLWLHQFGTGKDDNIQALAVDYKGAVYAAGYTLGQVSTERPKGGRDAFLAKYLQPTEPKISPVLFPPPAVTPINHTSMNRPEFSEILPIQAQTVLDFLNNAKEIKDLTDIETYRPDLSKEALSSYSIGEQSAQNVLDARKSLRGQRFHSLEDVLDVKGIGEDKILDIIEFIWLSTEEMFRQELFREVLGENWRVDYWRYALDSEDFDRLEQNPSLLKDFAASKVYDIAREKNNNFIIGSLAENLLEKSFADRVESLTALTQFASWWFRFDEDNWFSFDRISELIDPFLNYYNRQQATYIDLVFYRGFQNGGTVADGITPDDLVVTLNPAERAITIWGISLFD